MLWEAIEMRTGMDIETLAGAFKEMYDSPNVIVNTDDAMDIQRWQARFLLACAEQLRVMNRHMSDMSSSLDAIATNLSRGLK